jgi:hypothetical protein
VFNRQTVQRHLQAQPPIALRFVIPDHPWVDSANGADVRVAMSVGTAGAESGELLTSIEEMAQEDGEAAVKFETRRGLIHADLTVGARVASTRRLQANAGICFQGMNLVGKGFRLAPSEVAALGYDLAALPEVIKPHYNARDLLQGGEACYVIDFYGLSQDDARKLHPALFQWLLDRVKPERDLNNRESRRKNWWLFGEPVGKLRRAWKGMGRLIVTAETAKHRVFAFEQLPFCPDHTLYAICADDAWVLGVLSSHAHALWSLRAGGTLEDRPRWQNTITFLPFPFPSDDTGLTPALTARIRTLAEQIDAHRKSRQAAHGDVTLTGLYNTLEKLRAGAPLTAKERQLHDHGLVAVLKSLHDELDAAVLAAYGWSDLNLPSETDALLELWWRSMQSARRKKPRDTCGGCDRHCRPRPPASRPASSCRRTAGRRCPWKRFPPPSGRGRRSCRNRSRRSPSCCRPRARRWPSRTSPCTSRRAGAGESASPPSCKHSKPSVALGRSSRAGGSMPGRGDPAK